MMLIIIKVVAGIEIKRKKERTGMPSRAKKKKKTKKGKISPLLNQMFYYIFVSE